MSVVSIPGLVCTVFNWARPRDLSHYETFEHYHSTFYKHVEALSVTPFSAGATARGLAALLVSLVRQPGLRVQLERQGDADGDPDGATSMSTDAIEAITRRAELIGGVEAAEEVRQQLKQKMDLWQKRAQRTAQGSQLGYETKKDGVTIGLLRKPSIEPWDEFTCLNSLRDVEPTANLILDDYDLDDDGDRRAAQEEEGGRPMNTRKQKRCKVGELRPSQALTTFGIGSIIDLPNLSVMVMGLEDWPTPTPGDRRAAAAGLGEGSAGAQVKALRSPPSSRTLIGQPVRGAPTSASRSPRFPGGWSAPTVGGWPRSAAACSS